METTKGLADLSDTLIDSRGEGEVCRGKRQPNGKALQLQPWRKVTHHVSRVTVRFRSVSRFGSLRCTEGWAARAER